MTTGRQSKYERRVTLALKWHFLDNLGLEEIQQKFIEQGYGEFTIKTISQYVNSEPAEAVRERIREEHAETRLQVADRLEGAYQRARSAEAQATESQPVYAMAPRTDVLQTDHPITLSYSWEAVEPGDEDWPEWAVEGLDKPIRILGGETTQVRPGQTYPVTDVLDNPTYTKELVGIRREMPDLSQQAMLRSEQRSHLEAKGRAMGIYEETINLQGDLGMDAEVSLPEEIVEAVTMASHSRLESGEEEEHDD